MQRQLGIKPEKITLSQLEQYLAKAAWILKGPMGASDFKAYIFPVLFFKRISDVYDEAYQLAESDGDADYASLPEFHRFEIPAGYHWQDYYRLLQEARTNENWEVWILFILRRGSENRP